MSMYLSVSQHVSRAAVLTCSLIPPLLYVCVAVLHWLTVIETNLNYYFDVTVI